MSETIFDKIIAGDIPADIVYRDEHILAFKDINPQAPVHVLVIPIERVPRFADLEAASSDLVSHLFQGASKVARQLGLNEGGYRVVINNGAYAGQEVEHIHLHILSGRNLQWPPG